MAVKETMHWVDSEKKIPMTHVTHGACRLDIDGNNHRIMLDELATTVLIISGLHDPNDGKGNNVVSVAEFYSNEKNYVIVGGIKGFVGFTYDILRNIEDGEHLARAGFEISSDSRAELLDAMIK